MSQSPRKPSARKRVRRAGSGSPASPVDVTLKQICAFIAIADSGSFTQAAVVVNSTQSSLSVLIRELESAIGLQLLDRTTRKLALTEAGREYLVHARRIVAEVRNAQLSTSELVGRKRGRVVVAAPPIIAAVLLPPVVDKFHKAYPNITIVVEDAPPSEIVPGVASGKIDCGLGFFGWNLEGAEAIPVMEERLFLVCPSKHPLAAQAEVRWADLRGQSIVAIKTGSDIRRELDSQLRMAGIAEAPVIEVQQMLTVLGMVSAGMGVAIWPSWATGLLKAFDVQARPLVKPAVNLPLTVITPKTRELSPAANSFKEFLIDGVSKLSPTLKESASRGSRAKGDRA